MAQKFGLEEINRMDAKTFMHTLGSIYEHTPEVAGQVWPLRPFKNILELAEAMHSVVENFDKAARLKLVRNHPELGQIQQLTHYSKEEQSSAGLNQLASSKARKLHQLNEKYRKQFGFPFVVAVKDLGGREVIEVIQNRMSNDADTELNIALQEIRKIALIRLKSLTTKREQGTSDA